MLIQVIKMKPPKVKADFIRFSDGEILVMKSAKGMLEVENNPLSCRIHTLTTSRP